MPKPIVVAELDGHSCYQRLVTSLRGFQDASGGLCVGWLWVKEALQLDMSANDLSLFLCADRYRPRS